MYTVTSQKLQKASFKVIPIHQLKFLVNMLTFPNL